MMVSLPGFLIFGDALVRSNTCCRESEPVQIRANLRRTMRVYCFLIVVSVAGCSTEGDADPADAASEIDPSVPYLAVDGGCPWGGGIIYTEPGCGADTPPLRYLSIGHGCKRFSCSCAGKIIGGCEGYSEPYSAAKLRPSSVPSPFPDAAPERAPYVEGETCNPSL
jgi:hypothetical protein